MNTAMSVQPFPRADHKAKRHGRPKPKVHYRRAVRHSELAIVREFKYGGQP